MAGLVAVSAFAAGSLVETRESDVPPQKILLAWTTSADGLVNVTSQVVRGKMTRVVVTPGTAGWTNAITLTDGYGVDLLAGQAGSMVTGTTYSIVPGRLLTSSGGVSTTNLVPGVTVNGRLVLSVTSGATNNAKTGFVTIFVE